MENARLIVSQNTGKCSECQNVYFYLYDDRYWQRPSEAISILQKQFSIHLQTIHKMVDDSFQSQ